ncbi:hypothetical protein OAG1_41220 [Agarivorans sp. OAG1]|uniref:hypothetical protein n=1 Tax=Agarivorans sp. OAG1 TaxID=3082387 RepID=UPI002B3246E1|nr:hypothetical protein OAG1_41220 [Agarivorans sp. OAG1]
MPTSTKPVLETPVTNLQAPQLKELINTPWKKLAFVGLLCSQLLIFGFLAVAGVIGAVISLSAVQIASLGGGLWVLGEVMFFASIAILGKPAFIILKAQAKAWFKYSKTQA